MNSLRAAVAGTGFMGSTHIEALRRSGIEVVGVVGSSPEKTQSMARRLHVLRSYTTFDELCADPDIDVVHICTPNYLHHSMTKQAMEHGKHVICEKPLTATAAEARELVQIAGQTGMVGAVNYNLRYYPLNQEARARAQAGEIGEARILHGEYMQDWLHLPSDWNWRLDPQLGGRLRAVADIGTHWLDLLTWITGLEVVAVMADLATFIPVRQKPLKPVETFAGKLSQSTESDAISISTEDYAAVLLAFNNGARGVLSLSQISAGRKNHFWWEIDGATASMSWDQEIPNQLWIGYRNRPNEVLIKDPALMHPEARPFAAYPGGHAEGYPDTFTRLFEAYYSYLKAGDHSAPRPFPTFEDGWREMALCDAIQRSAAEKRWVEVNPG